MRRHGMTTTGGELIPLAWEEWEDWHTLRQKRLGEFLWLIRNQSGMTVKEFRREAVQAGLHQSSSSTLEDTEDWRYSNEGDEPDSPHRELDFFTVMFLAYRMGYSLADLEHFLLTGEGKPKEV
jgi:hypothetical protein